ncbi:MAG: serine/threonine protein kinase [bacterium]|nr:serine/threonine protein kinase [bacterium]
MFTDALAQQPEARTAFARNACADDEALLREVLDLLACHAEGAKDALDAAPSWYVPEPVPERIGPYRVLGLVGQGGMGMVYRAQRLDGGDTAPTVALKVLRPGLVTGQMERRFQREIEVLRRLDHSGIARLLDAGAADGAPYLVTEFVDGLTLSRWRTEVEALPEDRLRVLADLCDAIHFAHAGGVIHRDLKPENIIVTPEGRPKVLDFGIARLSDDEAALSTLATQTGQLLGTIRYMSPEQAIGGTAAIDERSDIYALGVLAFELLTGGLPYNLKRLSTPRALLEITTAEPGHVGGRDGALDLIVRHALEKDPGRRYRTAAAMADDVRSHLAGRPISLRKPGPVARLRRDLRARPRIRRLALGTLFALATVVIALALTANRQVRPTVTWAGFDAKVEEADQLRHSGPQTRENYLAAAAIFQQARAELVQLPAAPHTPDVSRYLKWRLGELYYFIGELEHDAELLEQARGYWRDAAETPWTPGSALGIDRAALYRDKVLRLGYHHLQAGIGMAHAGMARLQTPVTHLRNAAAYQQDALASLAEGAWNYHDVTEPSINPVDELAHARLNRGRALTALGAAVDSLAVIEHGLALIRAADETGGMREPEGRSLFEEALGAGYLHRAGLLDPTDAIACLDSARVHLDRARDLRGLDAGRTYWRLQLLRGALWERQADLATSAGEFARLVGLAREEIESSRASLHTGDDDLELAQTDAILAAVTARLAAADRDQAGFALADSLLHRAQSILTGDHFPLQFAEFSLRQGQVARLRWESFGDAADSSEAAGAFTRAARAVPAVEWPSLHRRVAAEVRSLRGR